MTDKLMKLARGRPCTVRLPGCDGGGETTVGAHYRDTSLGAGMGIKPHPLFVAHACNACHDAIDARRQLDGYTRTEIRLAHAVGVLRSIDFLIKEGILKW